MYTPPLSREARQHVLLEEMRAYPFACIVSGNGDKGLHATHVPVVVRSEAGSSWIEFHVARPNPHWRLVDANDESLAIFQGPQAYVHPGWYASKAEHGRVVPTWAYVAIHAHGRIELIEDETGLRAHLDRLTAQFENGRADPWAVSDAPADYVGKLSKAIVGMRLRIKRLEGTYKLNQHRSELDKTGVIEGLFADGTAEGSRVAALMKTALAETE